MDEMLKDLEDRKAELLALPFTPERSRELESIDERIDAAWAAIDPGEGT